MSNQKRVLSEVVVERQRQDRKWGEQNHHPFVWLAILGEEVGEANKELLEAWVAEKIPDQYRAELVQVAAVAVAAIECLDRHLRVGAGCPGNCGFEHDTNAGKV